MPVTRTRIRALSEPDAAAAGEHVVEGLLDAGPDASDSSITGCGIALLERGTSK